MMRLLSCLLGIFLATSLPAEEELRKDPYELSDIEPPLLIPEIPSRGFVYRSEREWEEGLTFRITEVTATDSPDPNAEKNMTLKIGVKVRPKTAIDPKKLKIQVFFYDTLDNKEVVLTNARVSYEWVTPHHDWKDPRPQVLKVTYLRPLKKINSKGPRRKYRGFIVRVYYDGQRQGVRAEPTELLNLFPPPLTIPSY